MQNTQPLPPSGCPTLSVVIPACNEGDTIEPALRSVLGSDYPGLQVVVVNDRSTDSTGEALLRLKAEFPHLVVLNIDTLPAGWLGKTHAQHVGSKHVEGDYILFTDADVHFSTDSLRRAMAWTVQHDLDLLVGIPEAATDHWFVAASVAFFGVLFTARFRPWALRHPKSRDYIGVGAFNLVRASAYHRFGGHNTLRLQVADDVMLGRAVREIGGSLDAMWMPGDVRVRWVDSVEGLVRGLTKNMFAGLDYSLMKTFGAVLGLWWLLVWPFFGMFCGPVWSRTLCLAAWLAMPLTAGRGNLSPAFRPIMGLLFPLTALIMIRIMLRSAARCLQDGGITWRGTHYPLQQLRKANRTFSSNLRAAVGRAGTSH
jgi:glycosyltransferase involved in cell wall biosynthesis